MRRSIGAPVCGQERTSDSRLPSGLFTQLSVIGTSLRRARMRATRNTWSSFQAIASSPQSRPVRSGPSKLPASTGRSIAVFADYRVEILFDRGKEGFRRRLR
jgi:hypothetical protein